MYVVEALKWNSRELHSYVDSVWDTAEKAINRANYAHMSRGGKYTLIVLQFNVNSDNDNRKEIYQIEAIQDLSTNTLVKKDFCDTLTEITTIRHLLESYLDRKDEGTEK